MFAEVDVGRLIAGKYELVRLIGKGAMGEVWLAKHNSLGGEFAIKLVQPGDDEEDETAAGRFQLEAQVSAKLSRKTRHIISVSDHGEEDGLAYLVMELLEGESLDARIKRSGEMPLAEVVAIVMQVARALGQAHAEQIFHRDLKPANVFLTKDEDGRLLVKLLDFGIARTKKPFNTRSPFATGKDMVLGTPSYMSPEQARGLDSLDHRCDLWALAVVAYEALTGQIPWEGETVEDIFLSICTHRSISVLTRRPDLPPALEAVFARSFAPKLDARFGSAAELSEAFELLVDPMDVEAAMGPPARGASPSGRQLVAGRVPSSPSFHEVAPPPVGVPLRAGWGGPGSDPVGFSVGEPTQLTHGYKKRSSGWLVAAVAALATLTVVGLAVTAFTARQRVTTKSPPADVATAAVTTDRTNAPPAPDPLASGVTSPSTGTTPTPTPTPTATSKGGPRAPIAARTPANAVTPPPPAPPPPPPPPPVVTATHAPPAPPAPPPSATATVKKRPDQSEVF